MQSAHHKPLRALFLGIDGATDDVIGPMTQRGDLPNIAALRARGAYGRLKSQLGYSSPALWGSIESGYSPETHGILGFPTALRGNLRKPRIHERLEQVGWNVGMCRMFCNWPPAENEVFVVPSFADVATEAHPQWVTPLCQGKSLLRFGKLARYLYHVSKARLGVLWKILVAGALLPGIGNERSKAYFRLQNAQNWLYARLFQRLVTKLQPDYGAIMIGMADSIGHRYWRFHHSRQQGQDDRDTRRLGGVVEDAYRQIDRTVGECLALTNKETLIVMVSDHGMEFVDRSGDNLTPASSLPSVLQLPDDIEAYFSGYIAYLALPPGSGDIRELLARLQKTRLQPDDQELFDPCHMSGERIRLGISRRIQWAPNARVEIWSGQKVHLSHLVRREPRRSGDHGNAPDGVVLFAGAGVNAGNEIREASQFDIAPTVLSLLGQPIPADCEGAPLAAVLNPDVLRNVRETQDNSDIHHTGPTERTSKDEEELIERLRELGYVD